MKLITPFNFLVKACTHTAPTRTAVCMRSSNSEEMKQRNAEANHNTLFHSRSWCQWSVSGNYWYSSSCSVTDLPNRRLSYCPTKNNVRELQNQLYIFTRTISISRILHTCIVRCWWTAPDFSTNINGLHTKYAAFLYTTASILRKVFIYREAHGMKDVSMDVRKRRLREPEPPGNVIGSTSEYGLSNITHSQRTEPPPWTIQVESSCP